MSKQRAFNRRAFIKVVGLAGAGVWLGTTTRSFFHASASSSANGKLNLGIIGVANRAATNLGGVQSQNIVALCDTDEHFLRGAAAKFPQARTYTDFRKLLENRELDAVVISTPDHTHAAATVLALQAGKHVYCEKPLTHTVHEARRVAAVAAKTGLVTQLGTQIHAGENYRRVVELIKAGAIGRVREAHVFCSKSWSGGERPRGYPAVPTGMHYDLWLGPAPQRPYHPAYLPINWRRWWDFGGGTLGDMGCHYMDLVHWALELRAPASVEAEGPPVHAESTPPWMIVRYEYPARGEQPPLKVTWYDGGKRPEVCLQGKAPGWKNGVLFVGETGMLMADYRQRELLPEKKFEDYVAPEPWIPKSPGHHEEWMEACKTGSPTSCDFAYGGALTESVLLGNVAYRTGRKLEWDAVAGKVTNHPEAMNLITPEPRKGWAV